MTFSRKFLKILEIVHISSLYPWNLTFRNISYRYSPLICNIYKRTLLQCSVWSKELFWIVWYIKMMLLSQKERGEIYRISSLLHDLRIHSKVTIKGKRQEELIYITELGRTEREECWGPWGRKESTLVMGLVGNHHHQHYKSRNSINKKKSISNDDITYALEARYCNLLGISKWALH